MKKLIKKVIAKLYYIAYPLPKKVEKMPAEIMQEKIQQFRNNGISIGENCMIYSELPSGRDCFLLSIGDDVTISGNVTFLMHDNAIIKTSNHVFTDVLGEVKIGNNCFIGYGSIILPGVSISDNCIIGAGSVVTKSIDTPNSVFAGNPAKFVCSTDEYGKRSEPFGVNLDNMTRDDIKNMVMSNKNLLRKR